MAGSAALHCVRGEFACGAAAEACIDHCPDGMPCVVPQINTLARAYAFLLECGDMTWQQLEEVALRPYNCEPSSQPALLRPAWQLLAERKMFVCHIQCTLDSDPLCCHSTPHSLFLALQRPQASGSWRTACTAALAWR